ncbi:heme utilization protein [Pseudomonas sp.]|uniref:heme utilization protein n=1 Tax=Pseudomonas sp. TaxID=306 RepID=UPI00272B7180|nr:heme utilization protein [Pseudomonas sp.]
MKTSLTLHAVALAVTAALAAGAYAGGAPGTYAGGSTARVADTQLNHNNRVTNKETKNDASIDESLNAATGNVGANVAAGDNNQQANAAAISTADALFVFGQYLGQEANASIAVTQKAHNNTLTNYGNPNSASVTDSGNGAQGNVGMNVAAGNYNQQKNDLAIASSEQATTATAAVTMLQDSYGNVTDNKVGDVYEVGNSLNGVASGLGWFPGYRPQTPVVNTASLSGSLNDASGNVGVNLAAGGGNQQSNALAIAAGCSACVAQ